MVFNRIQAVRGLPQTIKVDNGSEFISKVINRGAYENGVELDFSRPGKPIDNTKVELFNRRLREECLNANWFLSLDNTRRKIEAWRRYYNEARPHTALDWMTPTGFARRAARRPMRRAKSSRKFLTPSGLKSGSASTLFSSGGFERFGTCEE